MFRIQLRYGVALVFLSGPLVLLAFHVVLSIAKSHFEHLFFQPFLFKRHLHVSRPNPRSVHFLLAIGCGLLLATMLQSIAYRQPADLPGFNRILFAPSPDLEPSNIYRWTSETLHGQKVLSAGLRPYGLYGNRMSNQVFYNLPYDLDYPTLLRSIAKRQPDYFAVGRNPFSGDMPAAISQLSSQPDLFPLEYADNLAAVFRVTPEARDYAISETHADRSTLLH